MKLIPWKEREEQKINVVPIFPLCKSQAEIRGNLRKGEFCKLILEFHGKEPFGLR